MCNDFMNSLTDLVKHLRQFISNGKKMFLFSKSFIVTFWSNILDSLFLMGKKCFSFLSPLLLLFVINATENCLEMLRLNLNYLISVVLSLFYA